jgi:murein DD-endopeptidase MepM/ murein hydrolase activator NlpD
VTNDITALLERARQSAAAEQDGKPVSNDDRQKLLRIAQEFESMLLVQVLRDMRRAGRWDDEEEGEHTGLGAETLFETVDVELASHLSRAQGLGLSTQLLAAFDRMQASGRAGIPSGAVALHSEPAVAAPSLPAAPTPPTSPSLAAPELVLPSMGTPDAPDGPAVDGRVTSRFGWRRDPFTGNARFHRGVDLAAAYGQEVQAARAGRVVFSGEQGGYGNTVVVEHQDGTKSRYAHLSALLVSSGAVVGAGEAVGRAGHSGRATGTHVHFEITTADGRPVAPDTWKRGI